jgi:gluconolactonase
MKCFLAFTCVLFAAVAVRTEDAKPSGSKKILPKGAVLEEIWNEGEFTEGVAVAPDGGIYFSDISFSAEKPGRIMKFNPKTGKVTVHCADSKKSNGLMFDGKGRLLAACGAHKGAQAVCEITPDGKVRPIAGKYMGKRFNSPNDLVVLSDGTIYFSDPRYVGEEPIEIDHMSVYRVDPNGKVTRVTTDIQKPNGVNVSPDGKTLYVAETNNGSTDVTKKDPNTKVGRMTLNAFPIKSDGSLGKKRTLVNFGKEVGTDGMTVDSKGNIYAAVRADSKHGIIVYTSKGKELAYIPTTELPTNCCFGKGDDAKTLYVTSGKGLYRIKLNIEGNHSSAKK